MLPEIFGLIQCIIGCVIVFKHSQKVVWHRKWVLHPVVAPIRDQKNASKCPQNYHLGDLKIDGLIMQYILVYEKLSQTFSFLNFAVFFPVCVLFSVCRPNGVHWTLPAEHTMNTLCEDG